MTPWTIRLVLDVALVDEMLFTTWTIQWSRRMRSSEFIPNLVHGSRHTCPSVQMGKQMLSTASNERLPITDQHHTESNAPFVKDRGPKRGMYNQIAEKSGVGG